MLEKLKSLIPSMAITIPLVIFIVANIVLLYFADPVSKENNKVIKQYSFENTNLDLENNELLAIINKDNDKYYSDVLYKLLPKDKLVELAKKSWGYSLTVNNQLVNKDNKKIDANSNTIKIVLVEQLINDKMPLDVAMNGSLTSEFNGDLDKAIKASATLAKLKVEKVIDETGKKITVAYTFSDVKASEIITLQIHQTIKKFLGLDSEIFEIFNPKING